MEWHNLLKNPNDLPTKNGMYSVAIIRKDGVKRVYNNMSYRVKDKKKYYKQGGKLKYRLCKAGWNHSNKDIATIVAWKEKDSDFWTD